MSQHSLKITKIIENKMLDSPIEQLEEDIFTLIENLTDPTSFEISRARNVSASICRRWLIDRRLDSLARELGVKPQIPTLENARHVAYIQKWKNVEFYTLGGISISGLPINSIFKTTQGFPGTPELSVPNKTWVSPASFLKQKCSFGVNCWFTYREVLRYMANKAGGVHFDTVRNKHPDDLIDQVREKYTIGSSYNRPTQEGYVGIDFKFDEQFDFCYLEMMSIAQALCNVRLDGERVLPLKRIGGQQFGLDDDISLGHTHYSRVQISSA
jgi:hypothetical protein